MKRLIFILLTTLTLNAQMFTSTDTETYAYDYLGYWTFAPLYSLRDDIDSVASGGFTGHSYFRIKTKEFAVQSCDSNHVDSIAPDYLVTSNTSGVIGSIPYVVAKKQETYSGTTSGSGTYTVSFPLAYSAAPNVQANIIGGTDRQGVLISVTTTGFTITAYQRNTVTLLGVVVLLETVTNINGANIDVLVTEK